jgi:haloalkane dehalogenase
VSPAIHRHYLAPFLRPADRLAPWTLAQELTLAGPWYESLWNRREVLASKPVLILWGMRDRFMPREFLERWEGALPYASVLRFPKVGHFVQEEASEEVCAATRRFLRRHEGEGV